MLNIIFTNPEHKSFPDLLYGPLQMVKPEKDIKKNKQSMKEVNLIWHDFVELNNKHLIKTWVDIQKGHELLKTTIAFRQSKVGINALNSVILLSILCAVVMFAFNIWILPVIITVLSLIVLQVVREEATNAIIRNALKSEVFYYNAVNSRIIKVLAYRQNG
jgi:hypothetical protein